MKSDPAILGDTEPAVIELQSRPFSPPTAEMANAPRIPAIASLGLTISNPPTQAQVQAVANKVDELLAAMRRC
jgi:hypothetical protein